VLFSSLIKIMAWNLKPRKVSFSGSLSAISLASSKGVLGPEKENSKCYKMLMNASFR
jgi:hypothetical protein